VTPPRLVFLHGGLHTGQCWADTIDAIAMRRPDIGFTVVDLPGRRSVPGDLASLTIDSCVTAVTEQIVASTPSRNDHLVLIGHSLAGVIMPDVIERVGPRIRQVIFIACCVPRAGESVLQTLPFGLRHIVQHLVGKVAVINKLPPGLVRHGFGNSATRAQRAKIAAQIVPESAALLVEPSASRVTPSIRKSWVLTTRDRALPQRKQRAFIENLGGVADIVHLDAAHEVMLTHPAQLAQTIVWLAKLGSGDPLCRLPDHDANGEPLP